MTNRLLRNMQIIKLFDAGDEILNDIYLFSIWFL
jgi:hypothetical protein